MASLKGIRFWRLTILDRYLIGQFSGPFFLAVGGFALIAIIDILMYLVELTVISGIPFVTTMRLLVFKLPAIMVLFFPMAVIFAIMLLLVRMAKDNELTVLKSSGIQTFRILTPLLILSVLASYMSYMTSEKIVPWTNRHSDQLIREEVERKPPPDIAENVVFKEAGNRFFYIRQVNSKEGLMHHITVYEETAEFPRIVTAEEARWNKTTWVLQNGKIYDFNHAGSLEFEDQFSQMVIHVEQSLQEFFVQEKTAKEMDSKELKDKIQNLAKGGVSTRYLRVEYHLKQSVPVACFVFGVIGIAYCLTFVRSGKDWWGVIFAICISVLTVGFYFFVMALFQALAKQGTISPFLGAWFPNLLYGSIGLAVMVYQAVFK